MTLDFSLFLFKIFFNNMQVKKCCVINYLTMVLARADLEIKLAITRRELFSL